MLFVMGTSGRVGGALVHAMNGRMPLRAAGREPGQVRFDLTDMASFDAALEGVTAVFLMRPPQITSGAVFRMARHSG